MHIVKNAQKQKCAHAETATVYEYNIDDGDLGGATATINGRYPAQGFSVNRKVKQLVYVISGHGEVVTEQGCQALNEGDMIFLAANEKFAWHGYMTLFLANAPKFDPQQYQAVA